MQPWDRELAGPSEASELPPPPVRSPEHELHDRAKAAKLRHKAAKARLKAHNLEGKAKRLEEKANLWEQKADQLDGVVRAPLQLPLDE
ncbi:MAG: hypothetical protein AABX97_09990 [Candidatus Thermoplasmatota archaeon]